MKTTLQLFLTTAALGLAGCSSSPTFAPLAVPPSASVNQIEVTDRTGQKIRTITDPIAISKIIATLDRMDGPTEIPPYTFPGPQYSLSFAAPLHSDLPPIWVGANWIGGVVGEKAVLRNASEVDLTQLKIALEFQMP